MVEGMEGTAELMLVGYRENIEAFRLMLSMFLDEGTDELPVDRTPCRDVACVLSGPGGREWCTINIPVGLRSGLKAETLEMIQRRTGASLKAGPVSTTISGAVEAVDLACCYCRWATHFPRGTGGLQVDRLPRIEWRKQKGGPSLESSIWKESRGGRRRAFTGRPVTAEVYFLNRPPVEECRPRPGHHASREWMGAKLYSLIENGYKLEILLGEAVARRVEREEGALVAKVCGMVLEKGMQELQDVLRSRDRLDSAVFEAVHCLRKAHGRPAPRPSD